MKKGIFPIVIAVGVIFPALLSLNTYAADTEKPVLAEETPVKVRTNDTTPSYTFSTTEAGAIVYWGSICKANKRSAVIGNNTIVFRDLAAGTYDSCSLMVKDAAGNISLALKVNTFTVDITGPVLTQIIAVPVTGKDTTPNYTFSSTEAGSIIYAGDCKSTNTTAYEGSNIITFSRLATGVLHSNCTLQVMDAAGNASIVLTVPAFTITDSLPPAANNPKLNDTGITLCGDSGESGTYQNNLVCSAVGAGVSVAGIDADGDAVPAGQDALYGRDANAATNTNTDGVAGFSFTKLDNNGAALVASAAQWSCVKDNVTGLIWEVKTDDGGLRDKDWTYSWYNTTASNNGGFAGYADYADNCYVATRCDTAKFVADVNASNLCGAANWRLPTVQELQTIVANDRYAPAIDSGYFPHTVSSDYWSASPLAYHSHHALIVYFYYGNASYDPKELNHYARLVRGGY